MQAVNHINYVTKYTLTNHYH